MQAIHRIIVQEKQQRQRWPSFLEIASFVASLLLIIVAAGCGTSQATAVSSTPQGLPVRQGQVHIVPAPALSTTVLTAQRRLYTFAQSNVGVMQPVVDAQGNVWIGEMNANSLALLNARTGAVTSWPLPDGHYGIMATILDSQGDIWFSEQFADYIGRFDPRRQAFQTFPLGTWDGAALGPSDLQFDAHGMLWFTASDGRALGRLNPRTGAIHVWPLPASPSGLVVAPNGLVWFGYLTGGAFGSLDPTTGQITVYPLAQKQSQVYAMTIDAAGQIWFTEASPGRLGRFDPATGALTELPVPSVEGRSSALSELVIDQHGAIWFVDVGANMLGRYVPGTQTVTFFRLSLATASPFALTLAPTGDLWFTAGDAAVNYLGEMAAQ